MRAEWAGLNDKFHHDGSRTSSRSSKSFQHCVLGGSLVEMERLRVKFECEPLDIFLPDRGLSGSKTHPDFEVVDRSSLPGS
jgi:hypothetical protein